MSIWQLPSGAWYDDVTNQVVSGPGTSSPTQIQTPPAQPTLAPTPTPTPTLPTGPVPDGQIYTNAQGQQVYNYGGVAYTTSGQAIGSSGQQTSPQQPQAPVPEQAPGSPTGTPYFMGDYALVKFAGQNQTWLLDTKTQTIRPFQSDQALAAVYGQNMAAVQAATQTISSDMLAPGGLLGGYEMLPSSYAIKNDGTAPEWTGATSSQLAARYGYPENLPAYEQDAHMLLGGFMNTISTNGGSGISPNTINTINADPNAIGFYISALAYGGYTLNDIYRDLKRRELIAQGRTDLANQQPISASQTRQTYQMTEAGKEAQNSPVTAPPAQLGTLDAKAMGLSIYDIPDEAFKTLVPIQDPNSPEFKANMDKILTPFFDIMMQQLTAQTDQEKAMADYSWNAAKGEIERQLGVTLSNNALEAWSQIETAYDQFASQGIQGSGLQNEKIDDYLRRVRTQDQNNRDSSENQAESKEMAYYSGFASPAQVAALIASDPAKAQAWGLVPSAEILASLDPAALKAKYPNLSDSDIARYRSTLIDENGNYRSSLYQKYMTGGNTNADAPNVQYIKDGNGNVVGVNVSPTDTGKMDIDAAKSRYQSENVLINSMRDEEKAYGEFNKPDTPFLRAPATASQTTSANPGTPAQQYTSLSGALSSALQNVAPASGQNTPPAPVTQQNNVPPAPSQPSVPNIPTNSSPRTTPGIFGAGTVTAPVPTPTPTGSNKSSIATAFQVTPAPTQSSAFGNNFGSTQTSTPSMIPPKTPAAPKATNPWASKSSSGFSTTASSIGAPVGKNIWGGLKSLFGY